MVLTAQYIQNAYQTACLDELQALKPGNVHIFADGHDMDISHFISSAEASAPAICQSNISVGERIFEAVKQTQQAVNMNTNLGILLLCAPLVHTAMQFVGESKPEVSVLRDSLQETLVNLSVEDGLAASKAIVLASPAGLGDRHELDVQARPQVSLLALMQAAQEDDRIALQYANGYTDLFEFGLEYLLSGLEQWERPAWATSWLYLNYLCAFRDTHLLRKYGDELADVVMTEAHALKQDWLQKGHPKYLKRALLDWDQSLKRRRLNPGTSADLTVTTLLIYALCKSL